MKGWPTTLQTSSESVLQVRLRAPLFIGETETQSEEVTRPRVSKMEETGFKLRPPSSESVLLRMRLCFLLSLSSQDC